MENQDLQRGFLEKRTLRLERWVRLCIYGWLLTFGMIILSAWTWQSQTPRSAAPTSLRVSELVVVDPNGVERVRIGGDLPDAVVGGKRLPRGQKVAGTLLYDGTGQERGGYVTFEPSGNVGLTLDTRQGQATLFVAGPEAGSALQLWHGKDLIELRSDEDGSRLTAVKAGQVVSQQPPIGMSADSCKEYRGARLRFSSKQIMRECQRRFTESACRACLGDQ